MAHIDNNSGGRKTNLDLNLTPFIDLMSVCIIFLLLTAVWTQISMIQIGSSIYGKKTEEQEKPPPPKDQTAFRVDVRHEGFRIIYGRTTIAVPKSGGLYDLPRLVGELKKIKAIVPDRADVVVTVLDELPYESLIFCMDALLKAGFPEISVATAAAA
jgi:biopolymer transport protein ExbD